MTIDPVPVLGPYIATADVLHTGRHHGRARACARNDSGGLIHGPGGVRWSWEVDRGGRRVTIAWPARQELAAVVFFDWAAARFTAADWAELDRLQAVVDSASGWPWHVARAAARRFVYELLTAPAPAAGGQLALFAS